MKYIKPLAAALIVAFLATICFFVYIYQKPTNGVFILEYHKVNDVDKDEYTITVEEFKKQLSYLREQGYTTISLMDFIRAKKYHEQLPPKPIILTFDDGYEDNYTNVMPILQSYGMKGTVFVVSNLVGRKGYLTWQQLKKMQNENIELGCHTANHIPLTKLSEKRMYEEIHLSKLLMEWKGLKTIYFFSYPSGKYNAEAEKLLKQDKYLGAVTGQPGYNTFATDPYRLQRTYIGRSVFGLLDFKCRLLKSKLFGEFDIAQNKQDSEVK